MAWCPNCNGNYPIVTSVKGSSYSVPVTTERYNRVGEYIGCKESETYSTDIEIHPRCSNCYSVFEFPNVTSKEEYFRTIQKELIEEWRVREPNEDETSDEVCVFLGVVGGLLVGGVVFIIGGVVSFIIGGDSLVGLAGVVVTGYLLVVSIIIGLIVAVGLAVYVFQSEKSGYSERRKKYENEVKEWERKLNKLQAMKYSDENYEKLIEERQVFIESPATADNTA